jgi:CHAD domain-containing protein
VLQESLAQARLQWHEKLASVKQNHDPSNLHAFRLAVKRLRYRAEMLADFGDMRAKAWVKGLKGLQQSLGDWHDRHALLQFVAEFVGRSDFVLNDPNTTRSLVAVIEEERNQENEIVEAILKTADEIAEILTPAPS